MTSIKRKCNKPNTLINRKISKVAIPVINDKTFVKVRRNWERFWVKVKKITPDGDITGTIANHLVMKHPYNYGDIIKFKWDEVLDIIQD